MSVYIIPEPTRLEISNEENVFLFSSEINIIVPDGFETAGNELTRFCKTLFDSEFSFSSKECVVFSLDSSIKTKESYTLSVQRDRIEIRSCDSAGAFYAVETLKQLLLQYNCSLPALFVEDSPKCAFRSLMLDSARYFFKVDDVKKILDAMALHKLNCFHWHLTDDQGWRIELYDHLLLAQIGGFRAYTNFNKKAHGGFYSKEDIAQIVEYAHQMHIKVIPEIDSPGHVVSAIAAYPELSCFNREMPVATHSGVKHDVLCVGKESTFDFIFSVFDEVCEMFPDKIIHIGGDEAPLTRWKICPHCQKRMKELSLTDESQLHSYYLTRLSSYLEKKGFQVIMWENFENSNNIPSSVIRQFWGTDDRSISKEKKCTVINSNSAAYYFDLPYGHINLKQTYDYEPFSTADEKTDFLGAEACLWSEYVPTIKKACYCLFPRLAAFCENVWSQDEQKDFEKFKNKLPSYQKLLSTACIEGATYKQAMPNILRKTGYNLYFERRKLHWQGLHIKIENRQIERKHKKEKAL